MSYLVLARKYRPQTFEDLVGQDHVARTLANAIASGRIAHAFLFTGVRGVGKTTSARLLAKCLNCIGPGPVRTSSPTSTPCNECAPCREITAGQDLDVQEIDGASYNGVDEVRRLQEGVSFRPARDRFKIYIVDEVHMLSTPAWNAFLKTLEEPPAHVKFIFATTEVQKVPVTILSRCQRYDFKLITTQTIARRLDRVLALEGIEADTVSVQVLAREAAGSMRDAMSLLDQVIAFSGQRLTGDDVTRVLGVPSRRVMHDLSAALVRGDAAGCLAVLEGLASHGFDLGHVAKDLLRHLRNLVVARVSAGRAGESTSLRELLDLADEEIADVVALAGGADADDLSRLFQGFSRAFDDILKSGQTRTALEMALVRLARRPPLLSLDELLARVGDLERRLGGGSPPPAPPQAPRAGGRGGAQGGAASSAPPGPSRTLGALALAPTFPAHREGPEPMRHPDAPRPILVRPLPAPPTLQPSLPPVADPPDISVWRAIVERVRASRPAIGSVLEHAVPLALSEAKVVIAFDAASAFVAERASESEVFDVLTRAACEHFSGKPEVIIDLSGRPKAGARTLAAIEAERRHTEAAEARATVANHPIVREVIRLFGAQLRDIKLPPTEA